MIVIDTSALVAILNNEPERDDMVAAIAADEARTISAVSLLETLMVMRGRYGEPGRDALDALLGAMDADIAPFDEAQARSAFAAFSVYGKGIHPTARLNLCDCVAYALARQLNAPLLFKGDDFRATDVVSVL